MGLRNRNRERTKAANQFFGGSGFDVDADTYFTAVGLTDPAYTVAINQFILDLKAASLWGKFDRLWILANANAAVALTCIKSLEVMTPVNGPTFTEGQGYAGNGSTSYLNTGFIPATHGVNFTQNSASMFFYSRTSAGVGRDMGATSNAGGNVSTQLIARFDTPDQTAYCTVNGPLSTFTSVANADATGLFMCSRTGAGGLVLYKNGVSIATGTTASGGLADQAWYLGGFNTSGNALLGPTARQHAMAGGGSDFDDTEAAAFDTCIDTLKTAIGF